MGEQSRSELFGNSGWKLFEDAVNSAVYEDAYDDPRAYFSSKGSRDSDPTCSGALAEVEFTSGEQSAISATAGKPSSDPIEAQSPAARGDTVEPGAPTAQQSGEYPQQHGFFESLRSKVVDAALKADVQQIVKGLGSEEFSERERFQKLADNLPVAALKHLQEGLTSENPEIRMRTAAAIRKINNQNLDRCRAPMKSANDGFLDLLGRTDFSDETRKKYEDQLKLVDSLNFTPEELEAAHTRAKAMHENDSLDSILERAPLLNDPERMKAQIRLWYADWLTASGSPQDKERAKTLLQEAVKTNNWQTNARVLMNVVDRLGGPNNMSEEVKQAYEASKKLTLGGRATRPSQTPPEPLKEQRIDPDSTTGVKHR